MKSYTLTVFEKTGETILDETFDAINDVEAEKIAQAKLKEKGYEEKTHRCVSTNANLVLFQR